MEDKRAKGRTCFQKDGHYFHRTPLQSHHASSFLTDGKRGTEVKEKDQEKEEERREQEGKRKRKDAILLADYSGISQCTMNTVKGKTVVRVIGGVVLVVLGGVAVVKSVMVGGR